MKRIHKSGLEQGLYLNNADSILRIMPPLNISEPDLQEGIEIIDQLLDYRRCIMLLTARAL